MSGDGTNEVRTRNSERKALYGIITTAVSRLRDHELLGPRVSRKWIPAGTWVEALHMFRHINANLHIDAAIFNRAMACEISTWRNSMLEFKRTNNSVFFKWRATDTNVLQKAARISRILCHWMPNGKRKQMMLVQRPLSYRWQDYDRHRGTSRKMTTWPKPT
jgi:hypothetical protein